MNILDFSIFPRIETKRLFLRDLVENDMVAYYQMKSSPKYNLYSGNISSISITEIKSQLLRIISAVKANTLLKWAITDKFDTFIGTISLWNFRDDNYICDIGYGILEKFYNRGYTSEAMKAVIKYAFTILKMKKLVLTTNMENIFSVKIALKNNFSFSKTFFEYSEFQDKINKYGVFELENK